MKKILIIPFIVAVIANPGLALEGKKATSKPKQPQKEISKEIGYSKVAFKLEGNVISTNYKGHDLRELYNALDQRNKKKIKDEFETTEEFNARIQKEEMKPLYGEIKIGDQLALSVSCNTSYDADEKVLTVKVPSERLWSAKWQTSEKRIANVKGQRIDESFKKYRGMNAFGATFEVTQQYTSDAVLVINNASDFALWNRLIKEETFSVPSLEISVEKAKELKGHVRTLFVFTLDEPFIDEDRHYKAATIDMSIEFVISNKIIFGNLKQIIAYDSKTGEIIRITTPWLKK